MRVLITGKSGYIAGALMEELRRFPERYAPEAVSLRDGAPAPDYAAFDAVVHCAGLAHRRETRENEREYYAVNRDLAVETARRAKAAGVKQFVFLSSLAVYGLDEGLITPETPPKPRSAYGRSKLEAEYLLQKLEDERFRVAILRPPMVYGPGCKGNYHVLAALSQILPVCPTYENRRSAVSIDRLCAAIREALDSGSGGVSVPQDPAYLCTCREIRRLAAEEGRNVPASGALNFAPALLRRFTAKGKKAFGNLIYTET